MSALLIKSNGEIFEITPANGMFFTLQELQRYVGGYIEMVLTTDRQTMVVNEEGRLKNLPVNEEASLLVEGIEIFGDVIVCDWSLVC